MTQQVNLSNNEVADIYQHMLSGDKNALSKLQQVSIVSHLPEVHRTTQHSKNPSKSNKINTEENVSRHEESNPSELLFGSVEEGEFRESASAANVNHKKEQMMVHAIQKGAKMGAIPRQQHVDKFFKPPRRWANSENEQYHSVKKESRVQKKVIKQQKQSKDFTMELKTNLTADAPVTKSNKIYALPKVPKPRQITKTQTAQTSVVKKNASVSQPQRPPKEEKKKQKVDFKQMIGKSKQQRAQFQKKNSEELNLQMEIVNSHKAKKDHMEYIKNKFELNFNNQKRYLKKKKKPEDIYNFKSKQKESEQVVHLSPFKLQMDKQKNKCQQLTQQLQTLRLIFNNNNGALLKLQKQTNNLSYAKFLERRLDSMQDISEQDDTVEPLQTSGDLKNKYKNIMALTRQKKWGLNQRTQYEAQRTQSLSNSRQTGTESRFTNGTDSKFLSTNNNENKVTINERLKNLLFT